MSTPQKTVEPMNRRVVADGRGGPEVLQVVEEAAPAPQRGEVRVKILATGVSYADLLMREGVHPETPRGTITLGWDLVGVIDKLGADVDGLVLGETVAATTTRRACLRVTRHAVEFCVQNEVRDACDRIRAIGRRCAA